MGWRFDSGGNRPVTVFFSKESNSSEKWVEKERHSSSTGMSGCAGLRASFWEREGDEEAPEVSKGRPGPNMSALWFGAPLDKLCLHQMVRLISVLEESSPGRPYMGAYFGLLVLVGLTRCLLTNTRPAFESQLPSNLESLLDPNIHRILGLLWQQQEDSTASCELLANQLLLVVEVM